MKILESKEVLVTETNQPRIYFKGYTTHETIQDTICNGYGYSYEELGKIFINELRKIKTIKEVFNQATHEKDRVDADGVYHPYIALQRDGDFRYSITEEGYQKFADSIIQECAEVAECNAHVSGWELGLLIKKHFGKIEVGVEE